VGQNVRPDFISGVLSEEELGNKLHVHIIDEGYAGRVYNLRSYDAISRDILQRWTFPFVPDSNLFPAKKPWGPPSFRLTKNFVYVYAPSRAEYL
jgi:translation initiation factor eIF-2B subunit epsilon